MSAFPTSYRHCPWCSTKTVGVKMGRHAVSCRIPQPDSGINREFIAGAQVRWACSACGFGELDIVPPPEAKGT